MKRPTCFSNGDFRKQRRASGEYGQKMLFSGFSNITRSAIALGVFCWRWWFWAMSVQSTESPCKQITGQANVFHHCTGPQPLPRSNMPTICSESKRDQAMLLPSSRLDPASSRFEERRRGANRNATDCLLAQAPGSGLHVSPTLLLQFHHTHYP
jgi:hypothetical protein